MGDKIYKLNVNSKSLNLHLKIDRKSLQELEKLICLIYLDIILLILYFIQD